MKKNLLIIAVAGLLSSTIYASTGSGSQTEPKSATSVTATSKAEQAIKGVIRVDEPWARKPVAPSNNSAAYMKITNLTDKDVVLIGAGGDDANNFELHKSFVNDKGVSKMVAIDQLVIPAKTTVELAPAGTHIMLMDLKRQLNSGDIINIVLKIREHDPVIVQTIVK